MGHDAVGPGNVAPRRVIAPTVRARAQLHVRIARDAGFDVPLGDPSRPQWRGRVHLLALWVALPVFAALATAARPGVPRVAVVAHAVGVCATFAVSAVYHRFVHRLSTRARWRRADHATIFASMAGSATPVGLIAVPGTAGIALVAVIWAVAGVGAVCKVAPWSHSDRVGCWFYALAAVLTAAMVPALWSCGVVPVALFLASGTVYVVGARWFATAWPRLSERVFSYHEVWHVMTVVAAALHIGAVWTIAT